MKNYRLFFTFALISAILISCTGYKSKKSDTAVVPDTIVSETGMADWDVTSIPIMIFCEKGANMHILTSSEDSIRLVPIANTYTTYVCTAGTSKMKYKGFQEGEAGFGNMTKTVWQKGLLFDVENSFIDPNEEYSSSYGVGFTDSFLKEHQIIKLKSYSAWDGEVPTMPESLVSKLRAKYNNAPIKFSSLDAITLDKSLALYTVQFEPQGNTCMAMRIVTVGDSIYICEDFCEDYNKSSAWHADDEGDYLSASPLAITKSKEGIDIFYDESAFESSSLSVLFLRNGKIYKERLCAYYHCIDFLPELKPVKLPPTAVLKDEQMGYKVWVNQDKKPTEEGEYGIYSVYFSQPESENVYHLVTTNPDLNSVDYTSWPKDFKTVPIEQVVAANEAKIIPLEYDQVGVVLEGSPDCRNVFSYLVCIKWNTIKEEATWLPSTSGYQGLDADNNMMLVSYRYESNGRYDIMQHFTRLGSFVREHRIRDSEQTLPEAVDLGLSVHWASFNFGSNRHDRDGYFLAWGEVKEKSSYNDSNYKYKGYNRNKLIQQGVIDDYGCLTPTCDPVASDWGNGWRMPTSAEFEELIEKCKWEDVQIPPQGVRGYEITGPNGNSIFLPTGGEKGGSGHINNGSYGNYWTSSVAGDNYAMAMRYSLSNKSHGIYKYNREIGLNIRPVKK